MYRISQRKAGRRFVSFETALAFYAPATEHIRLAGGGYVGKPRASFPSAPFKPLKRTRVHGTIIHDNRTRKNTRKEAGADAFPAIALEGRPGCGKTAIARKLSR